MFFLTICLYKLHLVLFWSATLFRGKYLYVNTMSQFITFVTLTFFCLICEIKCVDPSSPHIPYKLIISNSMRNKFILNLRIRLIINHNAPSHQEPNTLSSTQNDLCKTHTWHVACIYLLLHSACQSHKLLDVYPLEVCFSLEPNKRIECPVTLTNRTDHHAGIWITPACCPDALSSGGHGFPYLWNRRILATTN